MASASSDNPVQPPAAAASTSAPGAASAASYTPPTEPSPGFAQPEPPLADNPEVVVGAAFVGGFLLGKLVKRLGS